MDILKFHFTLSPCVIGLVVVLLLSISANPSSIAALAGSSLDSDFDSDILLFHQDYTPPAPPPPPPHPPSVSCQSDLDGIGSLDTTCQVVSNLNLSKDVYVEGQGNLVISANVVVNCSSIAGCEFAVNVTGNFTLGENSSIICGTFELVSDNASFGNGSAINTTGLAGSPPSQTSGTPPGAKLGI
ncbi:hypothetical protein OROGR_005931 [Orobanche gracilis]